MVVVLIVLIVAIAGYALWTYPRDVVSFPVAFNAGSDLIKKPFAVPVLDSEVMITITIQSGSAIWGASIISGNNTAWSHTAAQGGTTTYTSDWIILQPGDYNFSFGTIGLGGVDAQVTVKAKGGFW